MNDPSFRAGGGGRRGAGMPGAALLAASPGNGAGAARAMPAERPAPHAPEAPAAAATRPLPDIEEMLTLASALDSFHSVTMAPDGRRIAWVEGLPGADGRPSRRTAGVASDAFRGGGTGAQLHLWIADLVSGRVAELTHLEGQISAPAWSADGTALAFLHIAGRTAEDGATQALPRDRGAVGETPEEQRLATVELATGQMREVSPPDLYVYEYDWSPDGAAFAAVAASGSGGDNWWLARLSRFARGSGAATALPAPP